MQSNLQTEPEITRRIWDITGAETALIIVPTPGDEVLWFGGLIAEACARGRPPFVMVIGDGDAADAQGAARASRAACASLGLPADRLLFAGLRQAAFAEPGEILFDVLKAAVTRISWRYDCNVVGVVWPDDHAPGSGGIFELARQMAQDNALGVFAAVPGDYQTDARLWKFANGVYLQMPRS